MNAGKHKWLPEVRKVAGFRNEDRISSKSVYKKMLGWPMTEVRGLYLQKREQIEQHAYVSTP